MTECIEKVTAFVTRRHASGDELLLLQHPHAGIQIPADTVEPCDAVLRQASEETGLSDAAPDSMTREPLEVYHHLVRQTKR